MFNRVLTTTRWAIHSYHKYSFYPLVLISQPQPCFLLNKHNHFSEAQFEYWQANIFVDERSIPRRDQFQVGSVANVQPRSIAYAAAAWLPIDTRFHGTNHK